MENLMSALAVAAAVFGAQSAAQNIAAMNAQTMIRDHEAVNKAALGLLDKLGASAQDNPLSQSLNVRADKIIAGFVTLDAAAFDKAYAVNKLAYHREVNALVAGTMIPNIDNAEVKARFEQGSESFKAHEIHAEMMVKSLN